MELSLRWAQRSLEAHGDNPSALFGIVQGGMYESLRDQSLAGLINMGLMVMPLVAFQSVNPRRI